MLRRTCCALALFALVSVIAGCGFGGSVVKDLTGDRDLSLFKLQGVRGVRDGDRLDAQAVISDSSSVLSVDMHFAIGSPTKLTSGSWHWTRSGLSMETGQMSERSVTFLGGQDGPPSIGGSFDLLSPEGTAVYRLTLPVTELKR